MVVLYLYHMQEEVMEESEDEMVLGFVWLEIYYIFSFLLLVSS